MSPSITETARPSRQAMRLSATARTRSPVVRMPVRFRASAGADDDDAVVGGSTAELAHLLHGTGEGELLAGEAVDEASFRRRGSL